MADLRQAAQQALDYIRSTTDYKMGHPPACEAALDLADALAEQPAEQEPVAWAMPRNDGVYIDVITPEEHARCEGEYTVPLYAAPPQTIPSSGESHEDSLKSHDEALLIADALEATHPAVWPYGKEAAAMLRKLYVHNTELENSLIKKSIAIQKIWKERDELRKRQVADEALLRKALEALEYYRSGEDYQPTPASEAITAIKERLK